MSLILSDRIKERVQSGAGTGALTLQGAPTGYKTFSSRLSTNDTTYYVIEGGGAFELGLGTLTSSTTFARTTILKSSNSDSAISVGTGQYFIFISHIADRTPYLDSSDRLVIKSAGIIFSDSSVQTTAPTAPNWGSIGGTLSSQTDLSAALALKSPLASPTFTGTPAAPTAAGGTNTTQLATTAFVTTAVGNVDLSSYIPYTGANQSINFGSQNVVTTGTLGAGATTVTTLTASGTYSATLSANNPTISVVGLSVRNTGDTQWESFVAKGMMGLYNSQVTHSFGALNSVASAYRILVNKSDSGLIQVNSVGGYLFGATSGDQLGVSHDVGIYRYATGPALNVQAAGGLRVLNLAGSADAPITCGAITASSTVTGTYFKGGAVGSDLAPIAQFPVSGGYEVGIYSPTSYQIAFGMCDFGTLAASAAYKGLLYDFTEATISWGMSSRDIILARYASTSALNVRAAGGLRVLNLAGSADAALTCGAITASGAATFSDMLVSSNTGSMGFEARYGAERNALLDAYGLHFYSANGISWSSGVTSHLTTRDTSMTRQSAGVVQIGTTTANALGSLACGTITASGPITTRNGTSPTSVIVTNTYTSATSLETLDLRANATQTAFEISSTIGSAGGTNRPINIGHRNSGGTFASALVIETTNNVIVTQNIVSPTFGLTSGSGNTGVFTRGTNGAELRANSSSPIIGGEYNADTVIQPTRTTNTPGLGDVGINVNGARLATFHNAGTITFAGAITASGAATFSGSTADHFVSVTGTYTNPTLFSGSTSSNYGNVVIKQTNTSNATYSKILFQTNVGGSTQTVGAIGAYWTAVNCGEMFLGTSSNGSYVTNEAINIKSSGNVHFSGAIVGNYTSIASTPASTLTGTWFTGGTATTTKPHFLIEPTGTGSAAWSTSGTGLGVNAASGFVGNLIDVKTNNSSKFTVSATGVGAFTGSLDGADVYSTSAYMGFRNKCTFVCSTDGILALTNWAGTGFTRLTFGGFTSSYPSIQRSSAAIALRLANDSADAALTCAAITASGDITISKSTASLAILNATTTSSYSAVALQEAGVDKGYLNYINSAHATAARQGYLELYNTGPGGVGIWTGSTKRIDIANGGTITALSAVDIQAALQCDSLRVDVTPAAEVVVCTHTVTFSFNGTNYKVPCVAA